MRRCSVAALATLAALAAGLSAGIATAATRSGPPRDRIPVVTAFYPLAYATEQVGGTLVSVANLTPAGAEAHDLELDPDTRDQIDDAALAVVMGNGFQPAVEAAAAQRDGATLELLSRLVTGRASATARAPDPHVWLDPALMGTIADEVARELGRLSPRHRTRFAANAAAFRARLAALDARYRDGLRDCRHDLIVTSHEAFGHLARAYGFEELAVTGTSSGGEPDPKRLGELADLVERRGISTVFTEPLTSSRVARTLAREAGGVRVAVLDPLEGLTAREVEAHDTYFTVMDRNLAELRSALDCA
jgi:zinc transport system substrate-binding protein